MRETGSFPVVADVVINLTKRIAGDHTMKTEEQIKTRLEQWTDLKRRYKEKYKTLKRAPFTSYQYNNVQAVAMDSAFAEGFTSALEWVLDDNNEVIFETWRYPAPPPEEKAA